MMYEALKLTVGPTLRIVNRTVVTGDQYIPATGGAIVASNHQSFIDSIFIPMAIHRRVTFVAKAEYFERWQTSWFFRGVGQIPIAREGGSASERAIRAAQGVLEAGGMVGIYPEGTRSDDGRVHRGRTGAARLALATNSPIIPLGITGTDKVQPIGALWAKPWHQVTMSFGEPIPPPQVIDGDERAALRATTDRIMAAIAQLSERSYDDSYYSRSA